MAKGKKTGGRKPGIPNKSATSLIERLEILYPGYHPVMAMAKVAHETKDEVLRLKAHAEIAKYICPQLKAIEHSGGVDISEIPFNPKKLSDAELDTAIELQSKCREGESEAE